jgi:ribosomal protein S18 acetylase RimI-like enzyme
MSELGVAAAVAANLYSHLAWPAGVLPGAAILDRPELLVVNSGLPCDTFNVVCRARLAAGAAGAAIDQAIATFARLSLPFAWWLAPGDEPAGLGELLAARGLTTGERDVGMALELADLPPAGPRPDGLLIRPATTAALIADYAAVVATIWQPPDAGVVHFYRLATPAVLDPAGPATLFVGYLDGWPVATAQLHVGAGVAGIYDVVTLAPYRRRGIGAALTHAALAHARERGLATAVLQAAPAGLGIYTRLGFRPLCDFHTYEWRPGGQAANLSL